MTRQSRHSKGHGSKLDEKCTTGRGMRSARRSSGAARSGRTGRRIPEPAVHVDVRPSASWWNPGSDVSPNRCREGAETSGLDSRGWWSDPPPGVGGVGEGSLPGAGTGIPKPPLSRCRPSSGLTPCPGPHDARRRTAAGPEVSPVGMGAAPGSRVPGATFAFRLGQVRQGVHCAPDSHLAPPHTLVWTRRPSLGRTGASPPLRAGDTSCPMGLPHQSWLAEDTLGVAQVLIPPFGRLRRVFPGY